MSAAIAISLYPRSCECCGSTGERHQLVWNNQTDIRTRKSKLRWDTFLVVCSDCGFAFTDPCPDVGALNDYYAGSFAHLATQDADFNSEKRLQLLKKYRGAGERLIEIGGNRLPAFQASVSAIFESYWNIEPNEEARAGQSSADTQFRGADCVVAYFVLEHIADIGAFFARCTELLRPDGHLIIEVPDVCLYADHIAPLTLHEHVNHFSLHSFVDIASKHGFHLREYSYEGCSRDFGFVAVLSRNAIHAGSCPIDRPLEPQYTTARIAAGLQSHREIEKTFDAVRERIADHCRDGKRVTVWVANGNTLRLLDSSRAQHFGDKVTVVDINPEKKDFLARYAVHTPQSVLDRIAKTDFLVLCSPTHESAILAWLRTEAGLELGREQYCVLNF